MDLMEVIKKRRSIRKYLSTSISEDVIKQILEAAIWAPSDGNKQNWRFIIVNDKKKLRKLVQLGSAAFIDRAPMGILVLYNNKTVNLEYADYLQSASAGIQNLLLRAHELNLGTCWVNQLPRKNEMRRLFNIPFYYDPLAFISIGYYDFKPKAVPRKTEVEEKKLFSYNTFEFEEKKEKRLDIKLFVKRLASKMFFGSPKIIRRLTLKWAEKYEKKFDN